MNIFLLKNKKIYNYIKLIIFVLFSIITIFIICFLSFPYLFSYHEHDYCDLVEYRAQDILGHLSDYYAIPAHSNVVLPTIDDINYEPSGYGGTYNVKLYGNKDEEFIILINHEEGRCSKGTFAYIYSVNYNTYTSCWLPNSK